MKKEMANMMKEFLTKKLPEIIEKSLQNYFSKFNSKIDQINDDITHLRYRTDELTGSLAYINHDFESASQMHRAIKLQNEEPAKQNEYMLQQIQILNLKLTEEEKQRDSLDQYIRRNNLELHGVPFEKAENTDLEIKNLLKKVSINLNLQEVSILHRLPVSTSTSKEQYSVIIGRFSNRRVRNEIYANRAQVQKYEFWNSWNGTSVYSRESDSFKESTDEASERV